VGFRARLKQNEHRIPEWSYHQQLGGSAHPPQAPGIDFAYLVNIEPVPFSALPIVG